MSAFNLGFTFNSSYIKSVQSALPYKNHVQFLVLPSNFTKWEITSSYHSISLDDVNFFPIYTTIYCFYPIRTRAVEILSIPKWDTSVVCTICTMNVLFVKKYSAFSFIFTKVFMRHLDVIHGVSACISVQFIIISESIYMYVFLSFSFQHFLSMNEYNM